MENEALVLDLLEWIAGEPKSYHHVMQAWRTSCPRLTIWEDAVDARLVQPSGGAVRLSPAGLEFLQHHRPFPDS